jgi:hypothetical protein
MNNIIIKLKKKKKLSSKSIFRLDHLKTSLHPGNFEIVKRRLAELQVVFIGQVKETNERVRDGGLR